jgi:hypothetical protein
MHSLILTPLALRAMPIAARLAGDLDLPAVTWM